MSAKKKDITSVNIYDLIGVSIDANEKQIRKAYRRKALEVHPDKNKDDPKANALFHQLSEALEVLLDASARSAYDKLLQAREKAKLRDEQLSAKRRKLKEDLVAREKAVASDKEENIFKSQKDFEAHVERLRRDGSRLLEEEQERLKKKLAEDLLNSQDDEKESYRRLRVSWDPKSYDYSQDDLNRIFFKYGDCDVVMSKKSGKALVEFHYSQAATRAMRSERGRSDAPLKVTYMDGSTEPKTRTHLSAQVNESSLDDFEALVLKQMQGSDSANGS